MDTLTFVSRVFTVLGQNIVKQCTSDLIIDLPKAVKTLESGEFVHMLVRDCGADNLERFRDCIKEHDYAAVGPRVISDQECRDYADKTLGWFVECILHLNDTVELRLNKRHTDERGNILNWKNEVVYRKYEFEFLKWRFADCGINAFFTDAD